MHFQPAELHAVHPLRIVLIGGTRIVFQHAGQGVPLRFRHRRPHLRGTFHPQGMALGLAGKSLGGVRMTVRIGDVRLDVVDGRAVHQVCSPHEKHRADIRAVLDALQPHAGQAQRVGTEGRPGGKHAHAGVAAQPGRTHGGRPTVPHRAGELPHQPDVAEIFQPPQGIRIAVFRGKDDLAPQAVHQPALARNAELGGKSRMDVRDDFQGHSFWCLHGELLTQ